MLTVASREKQSEEEDRGEEEQREGGTCCFSPVCMKCFQTETEMADTEKPASLHHSVSLSLSLSLAAIQPSHSCGAPTHTHVFHTNTQSLSLSVNYLNTFPGCAWDLLRCQVCVSVKMMSFWLSHKALSRGRHLP